MLLLMAKGTVCHPATSTSLPYSTIRNMCFWIESFNFSPKNRRIPASQQTTLQRERENRTLNLGISYSNIHQRKGFNNATCSLTTLCEDEVYVQKSGLVIQPDKTDKVSKTSRV